MDQKIPHTLLAKHFVNQTSVEESKEVRRWRAQSPENEKLYQEYLHEWEIAHADFSRFVLPDSDKMWGNILSRINEPVKTILYTKKKLYKAIAVAASIALLVGLSFSVWVHQYIDRTGIHYKFFILIMYDIKISFTLQFYQSAFFRKVYRVSQF